MAKFEKGNSGKPKGAKNKITKTVKEVVFDVFEKLQIDRKANLLTWGKDNPTEFYKIAAKLIPTDVKAEVKNSGIIKVIRE
jgi:hypothetical protein